MPRIWNLMHAFMGSDPELAPSIDGEAWRKAVERMEDARIVSKRFSEIVVPHTGQPIRVPHVEHDVEVLLPHEDFERRCEGDSEWMVVFQFHDERVIFNTIAFERHDEVRSITLQLCEALGLRMYDEEYQRRDPATGEVM